MDQSSTESTLGSGFEVDPFDTTEQMWSPHLQAIPIPGIRKMINLASTMDDVVHLSIGQPSFPTPPHIIEAFVDALHAGQTGYTMDAGLPELLTALAEYYSERYNRPLSEENILITSGATEAMYLALSATAAPGREFLIPDPTYTAYAPVIKMHGGSVKRIPTRAEHGHQLDPQEVIDAISLNTFGIVLNSPSNPTGAVYPRETIKAIVEEAAYRGLYVFSDEVYDHLILDDIEYPSVLSAAADLDHVMTMSAFSKTFAMAGLRVGWIVSSMGAIRKLRRYHMYTTSVASTPAQWAGVAALRGGRECVDEMLAGYRQRRDRVVQLLGETPHLAGYRPQGAFYVLPALPPNTDGARFAMRMLEEIGVCTVPSETFGESVPNSIRISYATSMEQIEEAFSRIIPWLEKQPF